MLYCKELASPKQTALGKDISNPFMADSLPKTIWSLVNAVEGFTIMVNPTIYASRIKQFWATASIKKVNDVVQLRALIDKKKVVVSDIIHRDLHLDDANGVECLPNEEIFAELARRKFNFSKYIFDSMVRNVDSPSKFLMYPCFLQVVINNQEDDLTSHNTRYTSLALTQKVFANIRRVEEDEVKVPTAPAPPSPTNAPSPPQQDPTSTPYATPPASRPQEQPTTTSKSSMSLLTTLMETCASLSQKVAELEQDKHTQALEILKLMKRVKKRMHPNRGKIEAIDADEDITLVDVETQKEAVTIDAEP
nr:hypothetical protein [Tanacetum cinerariifolium]